MYFFAIQHMVAQEVESYRNCITIDVNTKRMEMNTSIASAMHMICRPEEDLCI